MRWYNDLVVRVSQSAFLWLMSTVFAFGSLLFVFKNINIPFELAVGAPMFDFQNELTVAQIFAQLPYYDEQVRALYSAFLFIDFYFPFFAGLTLAAAAAWAWRYLAPGFYENFRTRSLFALFLIPTLFDWSENLSAIAVVNAWPDELTWAAGLLVLFKKGKLATVLLLNLITGASLIAAALKWALVKATIVKTRN
jgi:hypothetical protein